MNPSAKYLIPFLALALAGCSEPEKQEFPDEPRLVKASIRVGTSPMENLPLLPAGKSNTQMRPEDLNPIKTLAVFQYDPEGNFVLSDYHDYTNNGQSTGEMNVQLETRLAAYNDNSTVCLVANMPREECDSIAASCLFLRDFQDYTTEVPYSGRSETSLGYGLMESSYMSGYYEGPITEGMDPITRTSASNAGTSTRRTSTRSAIPNTPTVITTWPVLRPWIPQMPATCISR